MHQKCKVRCRAIILHENKLLVVKNSRGGDYYALPGGHLDLGESPNECMVRELTEELGVIAKLGRLLYVYTFTDDKGDQSVEFFFEIQNGEDFLSHEMQTKTHAHELSEVRWLDMVEEVHMLPTEIYLAFKSNTLLSSDVRFLKG